MLQSFKSGTSWRNMATFGGNQVILGPLLPSEVKLLSLHWESQHSLKMGTEEKQLIDIIKSSRSGTPNFEAHEVEANDLQAAVVQYLQFRGTGKASVMLISVLE
ncbi:DNA-directed RNA polymerase V subunit 1 [Datura stramonium]|uniref:DNA-directed RNA polymerase V subunit 1 n=1 Tax=Datura stramonium TaxID=4076 RepID=A0ABS8S0N0_DATST|nr:DNA-directed RNA polymerase V subunit 1 [Datura stramonium]